MRAFSQSFLMLVATAFALSYFYWSEEMGNLFGGNAERHVGMGFPFRMFQAEGHSTSPTIDWFWFAVDVIICVSFVALSRILEHIWTVRRIHSMLETSPHNRARAEEHFTEEASEQASASPPTRVHSQNIGVFPRISLRQLMICSIIIAAVLSLFAGKDNAFQATLRTVCLVGPVLLAWSFYLLQHVNQQVRLLVSFTFALLLIATAAVAAELAPELNDFTKGLLAVFICWLPAISLMALIATALSPYIETPKS